MSAKTIIAVYPGRFQPMGLHHKLTYDWMVSTFGYDNSFIATSTKVEPYKSPLNFDEKLLVAQNHGVTPDKFILCRSPYQPTELINKLQNERGLFLEDFVIVFVVGKKDMSENPRFRVGYKKRGGPTYYQDYESTQDLQSADRHGYLVVAPHINFSLPGGIESSGTNLRALLGSATPDVFEQAMGFYDKTVDTIFKQKFKGIVAEKKDRGELVLGTAEYASFMDDLIDDILHVKKSLRSRKNKGSRKEASRLQGAVDAIRYMNKKNERQLNANSLSEIKVVKEEEKLTRDEIKSYFDRLKR